jgi:hypothetical protein
MISRNPSVPSAEAHDYTSISLIDFSGRLTYCYAFSWPAFTSTPEVKAGSGIVPSQAAMDGGYSVAQSKPIARKPGTSVMRGRQPQKRRVAAN